MRTKRILKAFILSAALLSMGLTASRAMAACPFLFSNSFLCVGEVDTAGALQGPLSGGGQTGICTPNSAGNPCVTSAGIVTLNFANGSSATANFTGIVGASDGCAAVTPRLNTAQFCATTPLTVGGTSPDFHTADNNVACTAKGKPAKCCSGAGKGTCPGTICIIGNADSCPGPDNCLTLAAFGKLTYTCPAGGTCEYASDIASAGQGVYTYLSGAGGATSDLTGCTQLVQFTANKALDHFAYVTEGPLTGTCKDAGTSMNLRCQGTGQ